MRLERARTLEKSSAAGVFARGRGVARAKIGQKRKKSDFSDGARRRGGRKCTPRGRAWRLNVQGRGRAGAGVGRSWWGVGAGGSNRARFEQI